MQVTLMRSLGVGGGAGSRGWKRLLFYLYTNEENVGQEDSVYGSVPETSARNVF